MAKTPLIEDVTAVNLRRLADEANAAFEKYTEIKRTLDALLDCAWLLSVPEDAPLIKAKPVAPEIENAISDLKLKRAEYTREERKALLAIKNIVLELVPFGIVADCDNDEPALTLSSVSDATRAIVIKNVGEENADKVIQETMAMVEEVGGKERAADLLAMQILILGDLCADESEVHKVEDTEADPF